MSRDAVTSLEYTAPRVAEAQVFENIAAGCWAPPEKNESQNQSASPTEQKSLTEQVFDHLPLMSAEDVAKLSDGIAKNLIADGNLNQISGGRFGYSSAIQSAWIESGPKGVQQVVDKINEDLKTSGSDLRVSMDNLKLGKDENGHPVVTFDFKLTDSKTGKEVDKQEQSLTPFAQRRMSKEQVEQGMPFMAEIIKSGKFGDDFVKEYVQNFFRNAMNNGNLAEVTKQLNEVLEKAGSPYRVDTRTSHWEERSDRFGRFDYQGTDTVTANLVNKDSKEVVDTASSTSYALGVINNNIDPFPRRREEELPWPRPDKNADNGWPHRRWFE